MKKIAKIAASIALGFAALAAPVVASADATATCVVGGDGGCTAVAVSSSKKRVRVRNYARVRSTTVAVAVSGGNNQQFVDDNNSVNSGPAVAVAESSNVVNETNVEIH